MPPKRKGLTSKKMAEAREEGGIDVLPDALLQHILSFLSADEAVKTSASYPAAGATPPLEIHAHPAYCQNGGQMGLGELRGFQQHTHIYAPNLITLHLDILWGRVPFLKSIPSLLTGFVRAQQDCDDYCSNTYSGNCENCNGCLCMIDETGSDSAKCMLLGGLLEAKNLELIAEPEMSLLLNEWCVANNFWALACILKKSPVLENFTLQISKDTKSMIETEENYNVLVKPVVTSKHLKVVKVHCTEVDEGVYKIVKFLTTLNIEVIMKRMDRSTKPLGALKPSQTVLRLFIDSETLTMMEGPSQTVLRTFIDLMTTTMVMVKDLHKLFFGLSLIDGDDNFDGELVI
uniref:F-box family-8 n=1 Tax=Oryza sativa subsp. indica TaxID=39946 RepID=B9V0N5_ORYSI|nr:F-box family-8 [Oryza sativa Indica Group]